jgi:AcrR family transcriptional regulator
MATTRDRLSSHAARLFAERGYHGTSVSDLAEAIGIHKSSIYAHIERKEDLLAEIALAGAAAFHQALDDVPADVAADQRLRLALRAHLHVVKGQLAVATVWLQEWRFLTGQPRKAFLAQRHAYEDRIKELVKAAVEMGALAGDLDIDYAVLVFLSVANWSYTWFTPKTDADDASARFWNLLLHGMAARPPER